MSKDVARRQDYNPYEDTSLHATHPAEIQHKNGREGFNDIIKHFDRVNGFQSPKSMDEVPKGLRATFRAIIIVYVLAAVGFLGYTFFSEVAWLFLS